MTEETKTPAANEKKPEELKDEQLEEVSGGRPRNFNPQPDPPA